jgi:hypothetical protein
MGKKLRSKFHGRWRIIESSAWASDALDLDGPAEIAFDNDSFGKLRMIAIRADIDHRVAGDRVEFSWSGFDERDPISGRGFADLVDDRLTGRLFIHRGDESSFVARRIK